MSDSQIVRDRARKTGDRAPDFRLVNDQGDVIELDGLRRTGPVVLTFYRGGWCNYCVRALRMLAAANPAIQALGANVVALSPEVRRHARDTRTRLELPFEVLSDVSNVIARRYGLAWALDAGLLSIYRKFGVDLVERNGDDSFELPVPATYVIDRFGLIREALLPADYTDRARPEAILAALHELSVGSARQGYA